MKIWRMTEPEDSHFAAAGLCGAWSESGELCPECTSSTSGRAQPLIVEWESGSDVIGDFTWTAGGTAPMVTRSVCKELAARFGGFEGGPVEMKWDKKFERPVKPNPRARRRVWLPYEGPPLCELWVTKRVAFDPERTTAKLTRKCGTCGREYWEVQCVEWHKPGMDVSHFPPEHRAKMNLEYFKPVDVYRVPGAGLFVTRKELGSAGIFECHAWGWTFCTDDVKQFIEKMKYTNVTFWEFGEVVD